MDTIPSRVGDARATPLCALAAAAGTSPLVGVPALPVPVAAFQSSVDAPYVPPKMLSVAAFSSSI